MKITNNSGQPLRFRLYASGGGMKHEEVVKDRDERQISLGPGSYAIDMAPVPSGSAIRFRTRATDQSEFSIRFAGGVAGDEEGDGGGSGES